MYAVSVGQSMRPTVLSLPFVVVGPCAIFVDAWRLTRTEKLASLLCGLLLAGSFFLYFEGSKSVNKIGNCCPVFTVAAGILLGDLKGSSWRETTGVVGSIFLFVGALVLLTLASAEPEE